MNDCQRPIYNGDSLVFAQDKRTADFYVEWNNINRQMYIHHD